MRFGTLLALLPFLALGQAKLDLSTVSDPTAPADYFPLPDLASLLEDNLFDIDERQDDLLFPTLNKEQQRFAVNPAYPGYSANLFGNPTDPDSDDSIGGENDEVADDPFFSRDVPALPKKAPWKALMEEDPRIIASAIEDERINDIYFTTIVGVTSGLTVFVIVGAGFLYHRAYKNAKAAEDVEYPAYGVTGPGKDTSPTSGDRKLAQNAQLYHYQHQKQQMIAFDTHADKAEQRRNGNGGNISDNESEDGEEGDYTVYECPGLAPTGEMEVRNPMFEDDATPKATK